MASYLRNMIPLDDATKLALVSAMGLSLSDGLGLGTMVKLAHWNVAGPDFIALHELFDDVASIVFDANDRIAEGILTMGALVGTNVTRIGATMRIPDYPVTPISQMDHVHEVYLRLTTYLVGLRTCADLATKANAFGTLQIVSDVIDQIEKSAWKVGKHLESVLGTPSTTIVVPT